MLALKNLLFNAYIGNCLKLRFNNGKVNSVKFTIKTHVFNYMAATVYTQSVLKEQSFYFCYLSNSVWK